jgi:1-acyl-sn-glycerol-3-phosphate acyltransferase
MTDDQSPPAAPEIRLQQGPAAQASRQIKVFRLLVRLLFLLLFRVRVIGMENALKVPSIVCFNHLGWAEGFMVLLFFPIEPRIYGLGERQVAYLAPWRTRLLNWLRIFIPLDRDKPRQALKTMADVIQRGGSLAMAPEGHLGYVEGTISELQDGAAYLSQTTGAPIVPVGATGVLELWLRCRLTLRVGRPIYPGEFQGTMRTRTHETTARLDREIRALLPGDVDRPRVKLLRQWLTKLF